MQEGSIAGDGALPPLLAGSGRAGSSWPSPSGCWSACPARPRSTRTNTPPSTTSTAWSPASAWRSPSCRPRPCSPWSMARLASRPRLAAPRSPRRRRLRPRRRLPGQVGRPPGRPARRGRHRPGRRRLRPLVLQAARGNSMVFALAAWSVALDALTRGPRSRGAGSRGAGFPGGGSREARPPGGRPSGGGAAWGWRPRRCSWPGWPGPRAGCCCRWPPATASSPGGAASGGPPAGPAPGRAAGLAGSRLAADRRPAVRARGPGPLQRPRLRPPGRPRPTGWPWSPGATPPTRSCSPWPPSA